MADEPTGNLDTRSGEEVMAIISKVNDEGATILLVTTQEPDIAPHTKRILYFRDGHLKEDHTVSRPLKGCGYSGRCFP
jgi:putative ABC transport system ATP-binding protein